jgi:hypothetical protein
MKNRSGETQEWQEFLPENAGTMACIGGFRLNLIALRRCWLAAVDS